MRITDVRVRITKSESEAKLKAYADITFEESFVVHGLKVIDGQKGMFVAMPSRKMPSGEFKDIAHPISPEVREMITKTVIEKYEEVLVTDQSDDKVEG
ncbi:MAG: septation regulator SpoVG [Fusobacteria bacterium]|nr:septation regulator SpoVG [Fusobacteriota bacterium]